MSLADPALVLLVRYIQLPMQLVFNPPSPLAQILSHPNKIIHPTQGRNHADEKNIDQRMFHFPLPRIRYLAKVTHEINRYHFETRNPVFPMAVFLPIGCPK